jgi:hypothetical protein
LRKAGFAASRSALDDHGLCSLANHERLEGKQHMKTRLLAGARSLAAGMAAAAEPVRLDEAELDEVAAGALSGSAF